MNVSSFASSLELSKEVWKFQNEVRQNPKILIPLLEDDIKYFVGKSIYAPGQQGIITNEGPSAWKEAISFIQKQRPLHVLDWSDSLAAAAVDHAYDLGPKGKEGHVGSDKSKISDRIERHGKWLAIIGENIYFGNTDPKEIVRQLIVDDGVPSRGHRTNIFQSDFHIVGVGSAPHTQYGCMCVLDYAGGMESGGTGAGYAPRIQPEVFEIAKRKQAERDSAREQAKGLPLGCVSTSMEVLTRTVGNRTTVTTTTYYTFADGRKEKRVQVEEGDGTRPNKGNEPAPANIRNEPAQDFGPAVQPTVGGLEPSATPSVPPIFPVPAAAYPFQPTAAVLQDKERTECVCTIG